MDLHSEKRCFVFVFSRIYGFNKDPEELNFLKDSDHLFLTGGYEKICDGTAVNASELRIKQVLQSALIQVAVSLKLCPSIVNSSSFDRLQGEVHMYYIFLAGN